MSRQHEAPSPAVLGAGAPLFTRAALVRILPFAAYLAFIALAELLGRMGWAASELRWLYAAKVATVALLLAVFWRHYTELHLFRLRPQRVLFALAIGVVVLVLWIGLSASWMSIGSSAGFDPTTGGRLDWALVAVRIAGAALVVPLMEELFWRSFLMRWLDNPDFDSVLPARVTIRSVLISSVLFGFEHNLWLAGIVAGLAYSALYMRHRTIWSPILAHAVTNGLLGAWVVYTGSWWYW